MMSPPVHAGEPSIENMLESMGRSDAPDATAALPEPTTSDVNLSVQWRLWNRVLSNGEPGLSELETLHADAVSLGRPSLPHHQLAVLHTAQRGTQHGLTDQEILRLQRAAYDLAPHLPYAQFEVTRWEIEHSPSTAYRAIPPYLLGLQLSYQWLDTRIGWALKWALIFFLAIGLIFAGFLLAQLLRYFGIAAYDGTRVLPSGFSSTQTVILLVALVLVPGLIIQSPLLSMLLLLAIVTPFQQLNERMVACVFFLFIAALPWADEQLGELLNYPGSDAQRILHAHYHGCDSECRPWLEQLAADEEDYGVAQYTERVDRFRSGKQADMEALHAWFQDHDPEQYQDLASHWLNLEGAILIAIGKSDEALDILEESATADPTAAAPWFNQMRALQVQNQRDESQDALKLAFARDFETVTRKLSFSRQDPHSFLMMTHLDGDRIWQAYTPTTEEAPSLITPFWTVIAGEKVRLSWALWLGLGGILLLIVTLPPYLSRRVSSPCPKCGLARDPEDAEQTGHHHYCAPCYKTFVSGATMDYHARVHTETMLGRRDRVQQILRRIFSLLTPGVGHILGGHAIRGVLAFSALITGALILLYPMGPFGAWRGPFELFFEHWGGQSVMAWILISIGASVGLNGVLRGVESTRGRTSKPNDKDAP